MAFALVLTVPAMAGPLLSATVTTPAAYRSLLPRDLKAALAHKDFTLINVHVPYEGEIAGTDRFIPFDRIGASKDLPHDKKAKIVVYCRSGHMSTTAARSLVAMGYTNVIELKGGFDAWVASGYQLRIKKG